MCVRMVICVVYLLLVFCVVFVLGEFVVFVFSSFCGCVRMWFCCRFLFDVVVFFGGLFLWILVLLGFGVVVFV